MAEDKDAEAIPDERMARRIDEDPEFKKAMVILKGIIAESPNPHSGEKRLRAYEVLSEQIDVPHLSALALAYWFNDTYEDLLEDYPEQPGH